MTTKSLNNAGVVAGLAVVSLALQIPFLNRGISFYDEGSILAIADSLHHGEQLYRDRVTLLPPLTYELMARLFDLFGPSLLIGRVVQALVFVACVLLVYQILRACVGPWSALLGAVAFLPIKALAFPFWTVVNYSQLAMMFWLASMLAFLRFLPAQRLRWLVASGAGLGMTLVTKQNLAVFLAAALAVTVALDALRGPKPYLQHVVVRGLALCAGALPPAIAVAAVYAARGTLGDLVARAIVGLMYVQQLPITPLPWRYGSADVGHIIFTYFPTPLAHLAWEGRVDLLQPLLFLPIGHAVKLVYFLPVVLLVIGAALIGVGPRKGEPRPQWSALVLVVSLAAMAYASMLYRADWTHLMNVAPPLLILCVVVVTRLTADVAWRAWLARLAATAWLLGGALAAAAVFAAYNVVVTTPRGDLLAPRREAEDARHVLAYLARQPVNDRILFLRADPLYYFLSDRRIPIVLDLVMPALLGPQDDASISRSLAAVDQVIYNPKRYLTLATPVTEYAPHTAETLAADFRPTEILAPTAVVLKPRANPDQQDVVVTDLWADRARLHRSWRAGEPSTALPSKDTPAVERTTWMMYHVLPATIRRRNVWNCISAPHQVHMGDVVSTIPMLNPVTWMRQAGDPDFVPDATGAVFKVAVRGASDSDETLLVSEAQPGIPLDEWRLSLDRFAGRHVEVLLCSTLPRNVPAGPAVALAGWAEPRILRHAS